MIKSRLPWLVLGAIGGTLAASVVSGFEEVLSKFLMLASFIPVLVYLSDAVGTQSETLIVRNLALNPNLSTRNYLWREFKISLVLALVSGAIVFLIALVGWRNPVLSFVIGFSMFLGIIGAVLISTFLPLIFKRFNLDPAVATGPFATLISDITTLGIYFTVATLILRFYGLL
ncbi:MAG: Magnesium transporter MgtE [Syntrophomonadaceae bacterium]|nr:Magnesium transporter MgtE [Bacillota bacterium]